MIYKILLRLLYWLAILTAVVCDPGTPYEGGTPCYDERGKAQRCIPQFENAAFGLEVEATNTCGQNGPTEYCSLTQSARSCELCSTAEEHSAYYMTDFSGYSNRTWWQSETMYEGIQAPTRVNLTLHFGKAFDITYIRLLFHSPRPHSFAIFKKTSEDGPWVPFQYYSSNCTEMYSLQDVNYVRKGEKETRALCTSEFSELSPLSGGSVPFATLEGRPSANQYDYRPELWEWVSATDIRVTLDRLNTFGDEIFKEPKVLKSYFYAISDLAVGARCKCNGHASECIKSYTQDSRVRRICRCEHNTAGPDCNQCLPFYNDAPWRRASPEDAYECQPCSCNGFSSRCIFDKDLYERTGHGGHCLECASNRDGPNCERCKPNYYQPGNETYCIPCNCNETGSWNLQCNLEGKCLCKPGVTGEKCDRCEANFYDFGPTGCKECGCNVHGSYGNQPSCDPYTGTCSCKENVEGKQCTSCKPGYFNLDVTNEFGCTPCFCYGHSSTCHSSPGYSKVLLESAFTRGSDRWTAEDLSGRTIPPSYNSFLQALEVVAPATEPVYFVAPDRFLGNQRFSYNHNLTFKLRIGDTVPQPSIEDVVLEGAGLSISQVIFGQGNQIPSTIMQEYKFRLHEDSKFGWQPKLSTRDFMTLLSSLTSLKIRATYTTQGVGVLDDVSLETARRGASGFPANWVEMCSCPEGYVGEFCESCAPGSRHEPVSGGAFAPCVPCNCHKHAKICDADTGRCICEHNTAGENCERCAKGYYGNALQGTPYDCKPCPCPNRGPCQQIGDDEDSILCTECPTGYGGSRCEVCGDGFFGDPFGKYGAATACKPCDCNDNIDPNAIGNCNRTTGECLKCIYNTIGRRCDQCLPGYYGDALSSQKGDCKPCQCYPVGAVELDSGAVACSQISGQCHCKPHVMGRNCEHCEPGYFNIISGQGCESCECDPVGSVNGTCDEDTGQCYCRPGVTGLHCNVCLPNYYGFSVEGCKPCECDEIGSASLQCDAFGQCPCFENVEGRRCDRCKENKYDRQRDCVDCPPCYNLVRDAVNIHRENLRDIREAIVNISNTPTVINDEDFENKLKEVYDEVDNLSNEVQTATSGGSGGRVVTGKLADLYKQLDNVWSVSQEFNNGSVVAKSLTEIAEGNVTLTEQTINNAKKMLQDVDDYLQTDGAAALQKAVQKSAEVGEQSEQMSQIARDARSLVQQQEENADKAREIADKALNISLKANDVLKDAVAKQNNITEELRSLNSTLIFLGEKLNVTADVAKEARDQVAVAHKDALAIYSEIYGLNIPNIDTNGPKGNASYLLKVNSEIAQQAEKLLLDNAVLLRDVKQHVPVADRLLQRATEQQQLTDELLAEVENANAKAEEAVKSGDKTLQEAQDTLNTLQEFDKQVQESKDKSRESLKEIPEISKTILEAKEKTRNAQQALSGAEVNAQNARTVAQESEQKYAQVASKDADKVREEAKIKKNEAVNVLDETLALAERVSDTVAKVTELEQLAKEDEDVIVHAKEKVGQAKTTSSEVKKQVEKAAEDINNIMKELSNLPEIDENSLSVLAQRLEKAQREFESAKIDEEIEALNKARLAQAQQIKSYQEELDRLRKEVENIDEIRRSLPEGCWKRTRLEP